MVGYLLFILQLYVFSGVFSKAIFTSYQVSWIVKQEFIKIVCVLSPFYYSGKGGFFYSSLWISSPICCTVALSSIMFNLSP